MIDKNKISELRELEEKARTLKEDEAKSYEAIRSKNAHLYQEAEDAGGREIECGDCLYCGDHEE